MLYRFISDFNYTSIIRSFLQIDYWYQTPARPEEIVITRNTSPYYNKFPFKPMYGSPYANTSTWVIMSDLYDEGKTFLNADMADVIRPVAWLRSIEK